ncbi:hypothetical protein K435DRAFT_868932 [Dendrothele bispora CBS 962.96]|uniref:Uncharacterized protein n=1 Tax=Dendrothele bispora (strain CBS 962.96) TaxID=1314807 RepID=A0A4S8LAH1_DENBC|nr:hypothetical protein K435DRAFT_868932 [Dendrothele bispora CBS 962.96]
MVDEVGFPTSSQSVPLPADHESNRGPEGRGDEEDIVDSVERKWEAGCLSDEGSKDINSVAQDPLCGVNEDVDELPMVELTDVVKQNLHRPHPH